MEETPSRRRVAVDITFAFLSSFAIALALGIAINGDGGPRNQVDLRIFYNAGRFFLDGQNIYSMPGQLGFVYPPFAVLPFIPLAAISFDRAVIVWTLVNALMTVLIMLRAGLRREALVLSSVGATLLTCMLSVYDTGQVGILLLWLVAMDLTAREDGRYGRHWAGLGVGIAAGMKLVPAVFGIYYLCRRRFRAAAMCAASFVGTAVLGLMIAPSMSKFYWLQLAQDGKLGAGIPKALGRAWDQSLTNTIVLILGDAEGSNETGARAIALILAFCAIAAGAMAAATSRTWLAIGLLGIATCLATNPSWDHHYVWVVALGVALVRREIHWQALRWLILGWLVWMWSGLWKVNFVPPKEDFDYSFIASLSIGTNGLFAAGIAILSLILLVRHGGISALRQVLTQQPGIAWTPQAGGQAGNGARVGRHSPSSLSAGSSAKFLRVRSQPTLRPSADGR